MNDIDYLDQVRSRLNKAEKLFSLSCDLIASTEYYLFQARANLDFHEDILNGAQYVEGVDSSEIKSIISMSRIGLRYYGRQIEKFERELEDYRKIKNQAENDWKRANSDVMRTDTADFRSYNPVEKV